MAINKTACTTAAISAAVAEMVGMFLFVLCGAGTAMSIPHGDGWILHVSLAFGLAITVLAYAFGHHSGAQFNCAVTFGLVLAGKLGAVQGLFNTLAQTVGATLAAFALEAIIPQANDQTFGLGGPGMASNGLASNVTTGSAFLGETLFTCLLVLVVLETACSKSSAANRGFAPMAIGLAVFLGHSIMIPLDGCSINPTRTFGTAFVAWTNSNVKVSPWSNFWVFILGPLTGAALAVVIYHVQRKLGKNKDSAWNTEDQDEYEYE